MKTKTTEPDKGIRESRREFVKKSTLAGAGLAASTVLPGTALAAATDDKPEPKKNQGYQLTQHVIDYYKSAAS